MTLPPAVVFDCDGTIADTESLSDRVWSETLARYGYQATAEDFRAVIGHPFQQNWEHFAARADLGDQSSFRAQLRERFFALFDTEVEIYPDAVATIRELARRGVAIAVASSSSRQHVERVLDRAELRDLVHAIVGADDVERHKPHPEPYLAAADRVGVAPDACTAVEDTPVGIAAAKAARMFTVAVVRDHHDASELTDADRVVARLNVAALRLPAD